MPNLKQTNHVEKYPKVKSVSAEEEWKVLVIWDNDQATTIDMSEFIENHKIFKGMTEEQFKDIYVDDWGCSISWKVNEDATISTYELWKMLKEQTGESMSAIQFNNWIARHNYTRAQAAVALGVSRRMILYYLNGTYLIPKYIHLSCKYYDQKARSIDIPSATYRHLKEIADINGDDPNGIANNVITTYCERKSQHLIHGRYESTSSSDKLSIDKNKLATSVHIDKVQ